MLRIGLVLAIIAAGIALAAFWPRPAPQPETATTEVSPDGESPTAASAPPERKEWFPDHAAQPFGSVKPPGDTETRQYDCNPREFIRGLETLTRGEAITPLAETLAESGSPELLLVAAQIGDPDDRALIDGSIDAALAADPANPLILWDVGRRCLRNRGGDYCEDPAFRQNVQRVLGTNGAHWLRVARQAHDDDDIERALEAMQAAVNAPEFDSYYIQRIQLAERAFALIPDLSHLQRVIAAYALAGAASPRSVSSMCVSRPETDFRWLEACTAVAERLAEQGKSMSERIGGMDMQIRLYEMAGRDADVSTARARREQVEARLDVLDQNEAFILYIADESLVSRFFEVFEASDELSALSYFVGEVERLSADPSYDPCVASERLLQQLRSGAQ